MPLDYNTLTTHAHCDKATAEVNFRIRVLTNHEDNNDLADERTERSQSGYTSRLAVLNAKIASQQAILAAPGISDEDADQAQMDLDTLQLQRRKLQKRAQQSTGPEVFLDDMELELGGEQVTLLNTYKAGIAQRRAELSA